MKKKLCVFTLYSEKGASSQYRAYIFRQHLWRIMMLDGLAFGMINM